VRFIPISMADNEPQQPAMNHMPAPQANSPQMAQHRSTAEQRSASEAQPAFLVLAEQEDH